MMKRKLQSKIYQHDPNFKKGIVTLIKEYDEKRGSKIKTDLIQKTLSKEEIIKMKEVRLAQKSNKRRKKANG